MKDPQKSENASVDTPIHPPETTKEVHLPEHEVAKESCQEAQGSSTASSCKPLCEASISKDLFLTKLQESQKLKMLHTGK